MGLRPGMTSGPWVGPSLGLPGPAGDPGPAGPTGPQGDPGESDLIWLHKFSTQEMTARNGSSGNQTFATFGLVDYYTMSSTFVEITHTFFFHPKIKLPASLAIGVLFYEDGTPSPDTKQIQVSVRGYNDFEKIDKAMTLTTINKAYGAADGGAFLVASITGYTPIGNIAGGNTAILRISRADTTSGSPRYLGAYVSYPIDGGV